MSGVGDGNRPDDPLALLAPQRVETDQWPNLGPLAFSWSGPRLWTRKSQNVSCLQENLGVLRRACELQSIFSCLALLLLLPHLPHWPLLPHLPAASGRDDFIAALCLSHTLPLSLSLSLSLHAYIYRYTYTFIYVYYIGSICTSIWSMRPSSSQSTWRLHPCHALPWRLPWPLPWPRSSASSPWALPAGPRPPRGAATPPSTELSKDPKSPLKGLWSIYHGGIIRAYGLYTMLGSLIIGYGIWPQCCGIFSP